MTSWNPDVNPLFIVCSYSCHETTLGSWQREPHAFFQMKKPSAMQLAGQSQVYLLSWAAR